MAVGHALKEKIKHISKESKYSERDYDAEYAVRSLKFGKVPVDLPALGKMGRAIVAENARRERLLQTSEKFREALLAPDSPLCCQNHPLLSFEEYFPAYSGLHVSYVPAGVSFKEASEGKDGKYLVSPYRLGDVNQRLALPESAIDERGRQVSVLEARDRVIVVKIAIVGGKPAVEYHLDASGKEYLILFSGKAEIYCLPWPAKSGMYSENRLGIPNIIPVPGSKKPLSYLAREGMFNMSTILVGGMKDNKIWGVFANHMGTSHFGLLAYVQDMVQ